MKGKKTGGRMQGVPNRTTYELKIAMQKLLNENIENMAADLKELTAKERLTMLLRISEFIISKVQSTPPDDSEREYNQNKMVQEYLEKNN